MTSLRPSGFDELGLHRALSDGMLMLLIAAMAFLASLAMAGWSATVALTRHWQQGAASSLTVQVPQPHDKATHSRETRVSAVLALLTSTPAVASARALSDQELTDLLKPWLGEGADRLGIPMPAVIAVELRGPIEDLDTLLRRVTDAAPGTLVEDHGVWFRRLAVLLRSLQACAGLVLLLVVGVATSVIAVATRAGLATRREAIEIVHGLGATDSFVARQFARRAMGLAAIGGAAGVVASLPVLLALSRMAAPFSGVEAPAGDMVQTALMTLPASLWLALLCLPFSAALIGFATAQGAVRWWLRQLP